MIQTKYLLFSLLLVSVFTLYSQQENIPKGISISSNNRFTITIIPSTSSREIDDMKKFLADRDINFNLDKISFKDGKISEISGKVSCETTDCSFSSDQFEKSVIIKGSLNCGEKNMSVNIH